MSLLRKTIRKFLDDRCTDLAAALTYYSVLAVFPAMLALLSVMGLAGEGRSALDTVLDVLRPLVSDATLEDLEPTLEELAGSGAATVTFAVGLVGALWSASAYVTAFSRAMNQVREVEETRPFWKLRPLMLLITIAAILLCALALLIVIVSGPLAESIGDVVGLGDTVVTVWGIAKWPALALVVIVVVTLLYRGTPNTRRKKLQWLTVGSFTAIVVWLVASVGFAFYVANFSSYNKTYGAVAGVVVALLWLWLTNVALLFGAELDYQVDCRDRDERAGDTPYPRRRTDDETPSVMTGPDPMHDEAPDQKP